MIDALRRVVQQCRPVDEVGYWGARVDEAGVTVAEQAALAADLPRLPVAMAYQALNDSCRVAKRRRTR